MFVSRQVAETLLWIMVAIILLASGIAAYQSDGAAMVGMPGRLRCPRR